MNKQIKKILILSVGITFILFGLLGLVLPFLQGLLFLAIGFLLISLYFPAIRHHLKKHAGRSSHLTSMVNKAEAWIAKFIGEI